MISFKVDAPVDKKWFFFNAIFLIKENLLYQEKLQKIHTHQAYQRLVIKWFGKNSIPTCLQ